VGDFLMDTLPSALLRFARHSTDFGVRVLRGLVWPNVDLAIRLWSAQIVFGSGAFKLTHWQTALYLGSHEYPLAWMSPLSAAYVGISIEVLGGVLLAAGFMTRYAAVPMLILSLSMRARRSLERLGVEVLIGSRVERINAGGVVISGKTIVARTVLWAAGVAASPAAKWLHADADDAGRIKVAADLSVPNLRNVYAIGDTAASNAWRGRVVPGSPPQPSKEVNMWRG
jgi:hypothetical protein